MAHLEIFICPHQPYEEEEIVDLMLMKICSLFGIKVKKNQPSENDKPNHSATGSTISIIS